MITHKNDCNQKNNFLSRRNFLKVSSAGVFSLLLNPFYRFMSDVPEPLGRVVTRQVKSRSEPSFHAKEINTYFRDQILPIARITINDEEPNRNKVWYEIAWTGFVNSANIQPVANKVNPVIQDIRPGGALAEVTVPFVDSFRGPGKHYEKFSRLYYETTQWVTNARLDEFGDVWYRMVDDRWLHPYYVPAEKMRIFQQGELDTLSVHTPPEGKRIEVRLDEQLLIAYEWDLPVFMALVSSGKKMVDGRSTTPLGAHSIYYKRPYRHMLGGAPDEYDYDLPGVPWVSYFTHQGIAIHGAYWHNNFGQPISHGCINLPPKAAKWIYQWTHPTVPPNENIILENDGTIIEVIQSASKQG
jgi:hypothetical protein